MNKTVWVLAAQPWAQDLAHDTLFYLPGTWFTVKDLETFDRLNEMHHARPDLVLSLHWHWMVPKYFVESRYCVGFHSSDLPHYRGGSPIQNQIKRHVYDTQLTAFRLDAGLDTGPVLMKMPLSLRGTRDEIMDRIAGLVARMVPRILAGCCSEVAQSGEGSV